MYLLSIISFSLETYNLSKWPGLAEKNNFNMHQMKIFYDKNYSCEMLFRELFVRYSYVLGALLARPTFGHKPSYPELDFSSLKELNKQKSK